VIASTGASRSRAYELRDELLAVLPSLLRPVGRPLVPPRAVEPDTAYELRGDVTTFVMDHRLRPRRSRAAAKLDATAAVDRTSWPKSPPSRLLY
jgi:hypothetical protein